jgi:hypothetical protein
VDVSHLVARSVVRGEVVDQAARAVFGSGALG